MSIKPIPWLCNKHPGIHALMHLTTTPLVVLAWCQLDGLHQLTVTSDLVLQLLPFDTPPPTP